MEFLPEKLISLRIRFWNGTFIKEEHIEILIPLSNEGFPQIIKYSIAHSDESIIRRVESNLDRTFKKYKTPYRWIYFGSGITFAILVGFFTFLFILLVFKGIKFFQIMPSLDNTEKMANLGLPLGIPLFLVFLFLAQHLWPFIDFEFEGTSGFKKQFKRFIYTLLFAILGSSVYDLIKLWM